VRAWPVYGFVCILALRIDGVESEPPPLAYLVIMSGTGFKPGDDVFTPQARGTVIDVRVTPSGKWVFGIEDKTGAVTYFTESALKHAES
jgi:hypothetical protein